MGDRCVNVNYATNKDGDHRDKQQSKIIKEQVVGCKEGNTLKSKVQVLSSEQDLIDGFCAAIKLLLTKKSRQRIDK